MEVLFSKWPSVSYLYQIDWCGVSFLTLFPLQVATVTWLPRYLVATLPGTTWQRWMFSVPPDLGPCKLLTYHARKEMHG